jgi:hypothetical protein
MLPAWRQMRIIAYVYPAGAEAADVTTCDTTYVADDGMVMESR